MKAIDVHMHPPRQDSSAEILAAQKHFRQVNLPTSIEEMVVKYKELDIFGNILANDERSTRGSQNATNDLVAEIVHKYPEQFMGFASVDPWQGKMAVKELERATQELGLKGLKLYPMTQEFYPNDRRFYPIYEKCIELGVPLMFHTGTTGIGAGAPGGTGIHLKYTKPIPYIDDVAADFPELTIIGAHPSFPWQDEMLAVAVHKANVYIDLSGWSPKYFSANLIQYCNSLLKDKVMFGSDYPMIHPDRWLRDFAEAPFKEEVRPKILLENARRLFKLE